MGIIFVMSYVGLPLDIFKAVPNILNILKFPPSEKIPFHSNIYSYFLTLWIYTLWIEFVTIKFCPVFHKDSVMIKRATGNPHLTRFYNLSAMEWVL